MSKKKDIWDQLKKSLAAKLPKKEFDTWISQASLKAFSPHQAVIQVRNKFVANWLQDKYQVEILKSFQLVLRESPEVRFVYGDPSNARKPLGADPLKKPDQLLEHTLDASMTFERFLTADCNRFACSSALAVANSPSEQYNPLYLFSQWSLGKTHLLHAIGNHVLNKNPFSRVRYLSANAFTSDFTYAIKNRSLENFRDRYCALDLLLLDDVQLFRNRKRTQEEFLFVFNSLYGGKRQIVVTGDKPPNQLTKIDSRLKSRLGWGVISEIEAPDQNTKIDIIKKRAEEDHILLPDDVIFFLAKSNKDIKGLIKNIVRVATYNSVNRTDINISKVRSLIKDKTMRKIGIQDIKSVIAEYFNIPLSELISNKKQRLYSYPRQLAMYLCRKHTGSSYKEIGESFGSKDHSTVIYAVKRIEKYKDQKKQIREDLNKIENFITF